MRRRVSFHQRLETGGPLLGLLQLHPHAAIAELAGICGYDFVILDGEHGVFNATDYLHAMHSLAAADVLAIVRVPSPESLALGWYLDLGADALLVPQVETVDQARALARAMEYRPSGTRGFSASSQRVTRYGMDLAEHLKAPRQGAGLILMIETALGVSNAADIAAVPGVDGLFIGLADLSTDLRCYRDFVHPSYVDAFERIEHAALTNRKYVGTAPHGGYSLDVLLTRGHRLILLGSDIGIMRDAMLGTVVQARSLIEPAASSPPAS